MRAKLAFRLLLAGALGSAALVYACSGSDPVAGTGDRVVDDTHPAPSSTGTAPPPGDASIPDGYDYDATSYAPPDGYAPFAACQKCKCNGSDSYCLGGTTGRTTIESCDLPEGGADANASTPPQIGCNYFPPECAKTPTCDCLITALKPLFPCYPECLDVKGSPLTVYCPNP